MPQDQLKRVVFANGRSEAYFFKDGLRVIAVGEGGNVQILDAKDLTTEKIIEPSGKHSSSDYSNTVALHPEEFFCLTIMDETSVVSISLPEGKFDSVVTKLTGKVTSLSLNPSGTMAAIAGEDTSIKLVNLIDVSQIKLLKGQPTSCKSISYDPFGAYVAVAGCDGNLRIWDSLAASTASPIATLPLLPRVSIESENPLKVSWSSNGRYLAVPSSKGVVILRRPTWENCFTLDENIEGDVSVVSFSPNGNFLACSSMGSFKVLVFSIDSQECIGFMDGKGQICSIDWSATENSLICTNSLGHVLRWNNVVPSHMGMPFNSKSSNKQISIEENDDEDGEVEKPKRKKLKKASELLKEAEENQDHEVWSDDDLDRLYDKYDSDAGYLSYEDERKRPRKSASRHEAKAEIQAPFQPGSTPLAAVNAKRLMSWNLLGSIESQKLETHSLIHIHFSDVSFHQPIRFKDHFGFEIASFGPHGAVFASKKSENGPPSTLFYKPFDSWTSNTEWRVQLGKEEANSVAIGNKWLSVITDANYARIFSLGGRQVSVFQIPGPVLATCAFENLLAVAYHRGEPFEGYQNISCIVYDVMLKKKIYQGSLPISRKHELIWLGFSESKILISVDSNGVSRALLPSYDCEWVPILEFESHKKNATDFFWPVGFTDSDAMYVLCKGGTKYPSSSPLPILSTAKLQVPLLNASTETVMLESNHLLQELMYDNESKNGDLTKSERMRKQAEMDKLILKLIKISCQEENQFRALDLCTALYLPKSLNIAITIANYLKMPFLAQKMNLLLKSKFSDSAEEGSAPASDSTSTAIQVKPETLSSTTKREQSPEPSEPERPEVETKPSEGKVKPEPNIKLGPLALKLQAKRQQNAQQTKSEE